MPIRFSGRRRLGALAVASMTALGLSCLGPPAADAELWVVAEDGYLYRVGVEKSFKVRLGLAPNQVLGLAVDPDGELWALDRRRFLWRIDPENASGFAPARLGADPAFNYLDLTVGPDGVFYFLRREVATDRRELTRIDLDLDVRQEQVLGTVFLGPVDSTSHDGFRPFALEAQADGTFLVMDHRRLYRMSLDDLVARPDDAFPAELQGVSAVDFALSPDASQVWVASEFTGAAADWRLLSVDTADGAPSLSGAVYGSDVLKPRAVTWHAPSSCSSDVGVLCLRDGDFELEVTWFDGKGGSGRGTAVVDRSFDSGEFWFFNAQNRELLTKVLDGCELNGHYWVSLAGTTDLELELTVHDRRTGADRRYSNAAGQPLATVLDLEAFPCVDGGAR